MITPFTMSCQRSLPSNIRDGSTLGVGGKGLIYFVKWVSMALEYSSTLSDFRNFCFVIVLCSFLVILVDVVISITS